MRKKNAGFPRFSPKISEAWRGVGRVLLQEVSLISGARKSSFCDGFGFRDSVGCRHSAQWKLTAIDPLNLQSFRLRFESLLFSFIHSLVWCAIFAGDDWAVLKLLSVADPGFARGVGAAPRPIIGQDFCRKLHGNERNWTEECVPSTPPPWIREWLSCHFNINSTSFYTDIILHIRHYRSGGGSSDKIVHELYSPLDPPVYLR